MGPHRFCVVLDNPSAVFFPGQMVTGRVDLSVGENTKLKEIALDAKGEARVYWTESRTRVTGSGRSQRTVDDTIHFTSQENYFRQRFSLLTRGGESFHLTPGSYQYPFSFQLPPALPSSFEGQFGHVRYTIKVIVNRPWKFNYEAKAAFAVNAILDLNTVSWAGESTQATDTTTVCCWCCASGPISARLWIDKVGYVPGQFIPFCAQVDNLSGRTMLSSKVQLIQMTTFRAQGKSRVVEHVVSEQRRGPFGSSDVWDRVPIRIPPVPPSNLPFCNIITVDYRLEFSVDPGALLFNLKVPLNIVIGNVPLRSNFPMFQTPDSPVSLAAEESLSAGQYSDLAPPTYEEATFRGNIREQEDAEHMNHGGTLEYAPRYLTYQLN